MSIQTWTAIFVGLSFALYIGIAIATRVRSTKGFYVAGQGVPAVYNGMATAADWMSAASFISMAGLISFMGYTGGMYLMGWTGGYVLLALLLAPYLRKFGKYTVPDFVGDRYYSNAARLVAVFCAIFVSFTYVAGQMRGVGVVFSRFLEVDINVGVVIGMVIVFFYATLGGMKGITWTQVAQYCVLIVAFLIPAVAISNDLTGNPIPQLGFGSVITEGPNAGKTLLVLIDELHRELGFPEYTGAFVGGKKSMIDVFAITFALMVGTAGLPHVIIRFYTVKNVQAARWSAFWALLFIGTLYTSAPAVAAFARANLIQDVSQTSYEESPDWFKNWENSGLLAWTDKNGDGKIDYRPGKAFEGKPSFKASEDGVMARGARGERLLDNALTSGPNELYVDRDIMVLANPEIANLPAWVIALVAAGALAAALSTAAGLLLVISSAVAHDLGKKILKPEMSEKEELRWARISATAAVFIAGYLGINPPGFVAQVVAFAFGLAASSFFPVIVLGIFWKRATKEAGISGMLAGIGFTAAYIIYFKFVNPGANTAENWLWGISPEGIGSIGMVINFAVMVVVTRMTPAPPAEVQANVEAIRSPRVERLA
jgi:cation/acetate symporter